MQRSRPLIIKGTAAVWAVIALFGATGRVLEHFYACLDVMTRDIVPPEHRGRFFSSRNLMQAIITMSMVPLAGAIIEAAGEPAGYQLALGIAFIVGLAASYALAQIPEQRQSAVQRTSFAEQVRKDLGMR